MVCYRVKQCSMLQADIGIISLCRGWCDMDTMLGKLVDRRFYLNETCSESNFFFRPTPVLSEIVRPHSLHAANHPHTQFFCFQSLLTLLHNSTSWSLVYPSTMTRSTCSMLDILLFFVIPSESLPNT